MKRLDQFSSNLTTRVKLLKMEIKLPHCNVCRLLYVNKMLPFLPLYFLQQAKSKIYDIGWCWCNITLTKLLQSNKSKTDPDEKRSNFFIATNTQRESMAVFWCKLHLVHKQNSFAKWLFNRIRRSKVCTARGKRNQNDFRVLNIKAVKSWFQQANSRTQYVDIN